MILVDLLKADEVRRFCGNRRRRRCNVDVLVVRRRAMADIIGHNPERSIVVRPGWNH